MWPYDNENDLALQLQAPPPPNELSPQEEKSLLSRGASTLQFLGETIDKPFAALRGLISGHPEELANAIPFADFAADKLGWERPNRASGREVLERWGLAPVKDRSEGFGWTDPWDYAGLATELAVSPPMLGGPMRALTAAGKAAQAASSASKLAKGATAAEKAMEAIQPVTSLARAIEEGKSLGTVAREAKQAGGAPLRTLGTTPAAVGEEVRQGLRGALNIDMPWWAKSLGAPENIPLLAGSERAANVWDAIHYGPYSPMIPLRGLLDWRTRGLRTGAQQLASDTAIALGDNLKNVYHDAIPLVTAAHEEVGKTFADVAQYMEMGGQKWAADQWREMAAVLAQDSPRVGTSQAARNYDEILRVFPNAPDEAIPKIREFARASADYINGVLEPSQTAIYDLRRTLGGRAPLLKDWFTPYATRYADDIYAGGGESADEAALLGTSFGSAQRREAAIKNVPFGRATLNRTAIDPNLTRPIEATFAEKLAGGEIKGFSLGDVVHAKDRDNYGKIVGSRGGKPLVYFVNPETQKAAVVPLDAALLSPVDQVTPEMLKALPAMPKTAAQQEESLRALMPHAPETADLRELKAQYQIENELLPGLKAKGIGPNGLLDRAKAAADPAADETARDLYDWMLNDSTKQLAPIPKGLKEAERTAALEARKLEIANLKERGFVRNKETDVWERQSKAHDLADYFATKPPTTQGIFTQSSVKDYLDYMEHAIGSTANLQTVHELLHRSAKTGDVTGGVPVAEALAAVKTSTGRPALDAKQALETFSENYAKRAGISVLEKGGDRAAADAAYQAALAEVPNLQVRPDVVKAMQTYLELDKTPGKDSALQSILNGWMAYTRLWKSTHTSIFPAFHVRNDMQALWAGLSADAPYSRAQYMQSWGGTAKYLYSKTAEKPEFWEEAKQLGVFKPGHSFADPMGTAAREAGEIEPARGLFASVSPYLSKENWTTSRFRGNEIFSSLGAKPYKAGSPQLAPFEAGERAFGRTESLGRYAPYEAARKAGYTPSQAKALTDRINYVYDKATPFERNVARAIFPWWSWSRNNIPYQLGQLINNPLGATSAATRVLTSVADNRNQYMPEWLKEKMGIRVGGPDEAANVLRQTGTGLDDLNNLLVGDPGGTAMRMMGQTNPAIALGVKLATGKDPYTGRELKDMEPLYPGLEGLPRTNAVVAGLPWERLRRTVADLWKADKPAGLKAADLLSGAKFGTYDFHKQQLIEEQNALRDSLLANPDVKSFVTPYVPKKRQAEMSPEELAATKRDMRRIEQLNKAVAAMRKKKEQAEVP